MGAGLSSSLERRERRRWEKGNRKAIAKAHPLPEQQEDSSVTEITGPMIVTGSIDADQGRPERLPRITLPKERKDAPPMPAQVGPLIEGGILNNAQGVHIEGVPTFNNVHIHNTIVQPDSDPKKDAQLLKEATEWLSDVNYHAIQTDSYGKRAAGTGEWAFDDPIISKWLDGALGILWGVGMPGAGKTVLTSIIINHLLQRAKANKRICVAFAFSRYTDQFTGEKVLGGLLRQVVQDHPSTLRFVKPMYYHHHLRATRPSQSEILEVLQAIFKSDLFDERYCTLDGLDEALADTQVDMLDALSNLPVNFLLMSRPLPLLKELVPEATFIDIMVHDADIEQLIEEKLRRMKTLRSLLEKEGWKDTVLRTVVEKSSGMFLVASLQLDMLGECLNIKDLRSALEVLPVGVNAMYKSTMERIEGRTGSDLALQALTWLVYTRESLAMDDLRHALAVNTSTFKYNSDLLVDPETLLSVCCGLITFEPRSELVRLVHFTARDFLVAYLSKPSTDIHATLACICAARLQHCEFENYDGHIFDYHHAVFTNCPFLAYAHRNWAIHAQSSSLPAFVGDFILRCKHFPWKHPAYMNFDFLNSVQLAAVYNFHGLLARWLGTDSAGSPTHRAPPPTIDVNSKSANGRTALALAVEIGHVETVKLLTGVDGVKTRCFANTEVTPLMEASYRGHVQVVDMLLGVVDADHVNAGSCTALMKAVGCGHTDVIKSLLRVHGIDVNAREPGRGNREGHSALTLASSNGHLDAAQLLLEVDGIDVNASHWRAGTALIQASRKGDINIVKLLLQQEGIDVNSSQYGGRTALMQAARWGYKDIVKLLLERDDINVNATSSDGHSALSLVLKYCIPEIAELLRGNGAH